MPWSESVERRQHLCGEVTTLRGHMPALLYPCTPPAHSPGGPSCHVTEGRGEAAIQERTAGHMISCLLVLWRAGPTCKPSPPRAFLPPSLPTAQSHPDLLVGPRTIVTFLTQLDVLPGASRPPNSRSPQRYWVLSPEILGELAQDESLRMGFPPLVPLASKKLEG